MSSCDSPLHKFVYSLLSVAPSLLATSLVEEKVFPIFWENTPADPRAKKNDNNIKDINVEELDMALGTRLKITIKFTEMRHSSQPLKLCISNLMIWLKETINYSNLDSVLQINLNLIKNHI